MSMSQSEVDALALSLALRFLALRAGQTSQAPAGGRPYTTEDATRLAVRFRQSATTRLDPGCSHILQTFNALNREIDRYENPVLQEKALDLIPFEALHEQAAAIQEADESLGFQDALVQALVEWAKNDFLKWVDPVNCSQCGGETEGIGGSEPTQQERYEGGAGRVEVYRCKTLACQGRLKRFPRYTKLEKLLETRTGRCGEFAAIFMLLLRALSVKAKYVWNSEDHVWNEYYSDELKRWVHIDSCEGARDKSLLYDRGWGKKMRYCIAFGTDGARDVTRAYVSDWPETMSRRTSSWEAPIQHTLSQITQSRRAHLSPSEREGLNLVDNAEEVWLQDSLARVSAADKEHLSGRTSGTKEWREQRSELGKNQKARGPSLKAGNRFLDSNTAVPQCNGSAQARNGSVVLTENVPDKTGSAFLALPMGLTSFIVTFSFRITNDGSGADGMAFVLHSAPTGLATLGRGGCDLGYGGIPSSIAVEIDTYRSQDRCNDPPTPHISVHSREGLSNEAHHRSSLWCTKPGSLPDLDDGKEYWSKLEFGQKLRIWFSDKRDGFEELTEEAVEVPELEGQKYIGWTASTGGLHQSHEVTSFEVWEGMEEDVARDGMM